MMKRQKLQRKYVPEETNPALIQRAIDQMWGEFNRRHRRGQWPFTRDYVYFQHKRHTAMRKRRVHRASQVVEGQIVPIGKWRFRQEGQRLVPCAGR